MVSSSPSSRRRSNAQRVVVVLAAVAVAGLALQSYLDWRQSFDDLTAVAERLGVADRRPGLIAGMRRDAGSTRAALRLARAILADELDQRWILDLPADAQAEERQRGLERLDVAYDLGLRSLGERPGSWEALLVIGGAEYLRTARRQRSRLLLERELWRAPLEEAHRLAPVQPEPLRFLVAADLGNWSVLSPAERERAIARIVTAFRDPTTFDLLSQAWLRVAPSLTEALAVVPDTVGAWSGLARYFARRGDWERLRDARETLLRMQRDFARARLEEAESRLRWGDRDKGIQRLLWVAARTPVDGANVEIIERVLELMPPGSTGEAGERWLRPWLDWALARCGRGRECPLTRQSLRRLVSLSDDLPPEAEAWALAVADRLRDAEAIEEQARATGGALGPEWAPYLIAKARWLTALGEALRALATLRAIPLMGRDSVHYWTTVREVAAAAGDSLEVAEAEAWLGAKARRRWDVDDWSTARRGATLALLPAADATGLELRIRAEGDGRGLLEIVWDGSLVEMVTASDGAVVRLLVPVDRSTHELEIRPAEGAAIARAEVRLLPPAA